MVVKTFQNKIPGFFQVFQVINDKIPGDFLQGTATKNVDKWQKMLEKSQNESRYAENAEIC